MKSKWFEKVGQTPGDNFISSRVRLARNWDEYAFPNRLTNEQAAELVGRLQYGLDDIEIVEKKNFITTTLDRIKEVDRLALKERRIMNATIAEGKTPTGLIISDTEDVSILLNGDDHIRMQFLAPGMALDELWERADKMDDFVNSRFNYCYDEKYGYLTSYPTNVGTGMRANVVVHLPALAKSNEAKNLIDGFSQFGVTIRVVYGSLYDISNTKTLGVSEKEIIETVSRIANQLNEREIQLRETALEKDFTGRLDEAWKAYGVLKYARTMKLNSALMYLSQLRTGIQDGLIIPEEDRSIYKLMLDIQPGNLLLHADKPVDRSELDELRADYLRENIPKIKEA